MLDQEDLVAIIPRINSDRPMFLKAQPRAVASTQTLPLAGVIAGDSLVVATLKLSHSQLKVAMRQLFRSAEQGQNLTGERES